MSLSSIRLEVPMQMRSLNAVLLVLSTGLLLASGTQHEHAVIGETHAAAVRSAEATFASRQDARSLQALAQAYGDANAPGLAVRAVESAPAALRTSPVVEHAYARALLDSGRAVDALAAEKRVLDACAAADEEGSACDTWLLASATRRSDILRELVQLGIEDAQAHPEASAVAYHNATRQARLAIR